MTGFPVDRLTASTYVVPTERPEADGTLAWDATTVVVVEATGAGRTGLGWTYSGRGCQAVVEDVLAPAVVGRDVDDVPGSWNAMVRAIRNLGRPGMVSATLAAVDVALWDLKAKAFDVPLCALLGQSRDTVPVYGSGGFTTYDEAILKSQLEQWMGLGISRVKIKIGENDGGCEARDLERVAQVRATVGPDVEVFVDANGGYTRKQAIRVGRRLVDQYDVRWFEEPVSSDDLDGLREVRDALDSEVTAGEYGCDLPYFRRMLDAGAVDCLQADVTRTAGISEWVRVAGVAASHGVELSAHCAPSLHLHPAAAVPNLRHVEWFADHVRLEGLLFDPGPSVAGGVMRPDLERPGIGVQLKAADAATFRVG